MFVKDKMENFNRVLITSFYAKVDNPKKNIKAVRIPVSNLDDYKHHATILNKNGGIGEIVGLDEYQVKPYFDYDDKSGNVPEKIEDEISKALLKVCPTEVFISGRPSREEDGIEKFSRRFYVKARITYKNIPIVFKEVFEKFPCLDKGVYDTNRMMLTPLNNKKGSESVPELNVIKGDIFDCCATFINQDYPDIDWKAEIVQKNEKFNNTIEFMKKIINDVDIKDEDDENDGDKYLKLKNIISKISEKRANKYETWSSFVWCLINIGKKEELNDNKIKRLIHEFSKLASKEYDEDKVDDWIDKNFDKVRDYGYGWNYLYETCLKEDAPSYYERLIKSYYNVKKEFEKNHLKIIHPPFIIYVDDDDNNIIQPIPLCEKSYRHILASFKEEKKDKNGKDVYKNKRFIEKWLDDPQIRLYNKMVFKPPPLFVKSNDYNTWTNFEILKTSYNFNENYKNDIIQRFLDYSNKLFDNEEIVNYILSYFANRLQNPANRNNVCLILYGEEGDGKNRFLDIFKNIIGKKYWTELESAKQLFSAHSCVEKEKLFICVNEARGKDNYENSEILKARITTETLLVNPKGIQEFEIDNFCDYVMTTNNHNAINIHDKSRRFLFVETTSFFSRNSEFFNSFSKDIVDNKDALRVIYDYLINFDISKIIPSGNFQNHIPITEIQKTIIRDNKDKIELFLMDLVSNEENDELKLKNGLLFTMWCNWVDINKIKIEYNSISFGTRLGLLVKKKNITQMVKKDTHSNIIIDINQLRKYFKETP